MRNFNGHLMSVHVSCSGLKLYLMIVCLLLLGCGMELDGRLRWLYTFWASVENTFVQFSCDAVC